MIDTTKITDEQIQTAAKIDDLDEAILPLMSTMGQETGHYSGLFFAGEIGNEWPTASYRRRVEILQSYIAFEDDMANTDD